jgi:hypothetical protein
MVGTIGSGQLGQPGPWGVFPSYGQGAGTYPFTQHMQSFAQPLQYTPFGHGTINYPFGGQTAHYAPLQQIQQLLHVLPQQLQQLQQLQQHQHHIQQQQLHQLQQLLQIVPQQLQQLQQLVHLLPQQLQHIQQLVQFVPQQISQLQQQLQAQHTAFGASIPGVAGGGLSQPFGNPFAWSASAQGVQPLPSAQPFGLPSPTGQVM